AEDQSRPPDELSPEFLREYVRTGSEAAFRRIVEAHVDFVYAVARRQVRDAHLAEDVTQAVFIILARKAASLRSGAKLRAWLFSTTRLAAAGALKMARRRQHHEREAAKMIEASQCHDAGSQQLAPDLQRGLEQG